MRVPSRTLLLCIFYFLFFSCAFLAVRNSNAAAPVIGMISLYQANGEAQCNFAATSGVHHFPKWSSRPYPCKFLEFGGYFKLSAVPSATRIWLIYGTGDGESTQPRNCGANEENAFGWIELLTIKNPTTTDPSVNNGLINIKDLYTLPIKSVVTPGVRLMERKLHHGILHVTCMIVDVSPEASGREKTAPSGPPKITLEGANGENHCTLDFTTKNYIFKDNKHCNNDEAIKLELEHAPSASNILLFDDYSCDRNDDGNYFWVYLRTIKEDVSTVSLIDLDDIATAPIGSVVAPGIRLMDRYKKPGESMKKRTSCVQIQVDAPPLPSVKRH
ncbi:hypothetical protein ALP45_200034 [Pseudomonas coronafaciens pv. atropurpurea]|uniref:hypothetical protein n=1 Tax=Pseudomonas coronafaciens TaxID=53409 RepID=UPI0006E636C1|nr:hypothetical protein [Pseudomonas coronafaciens]KPW33990.1 hypothetical protein ALO66_200084 [Pseudomonas coronafaciens pv. atropurpurea]RMT61492.1 hypothetical protein ALP45_200034 [Pseudomonas coronafaciens pv. atropurpurea]